MAEHLISQMSHVEVLADDVERSAEFYTGILGFEESGRDGRSVYLRGWGEHFYGTVKLTEGAGPGLHHFGWRTEGPEELDVVVARIEKLGVGEGWVEGDAGHGPAYRFRGPSGHLAEVHWDVTWYETPAERRSALLDRAQRFYPRGAAARQIDHVTLGVTDVAAERDFYVETLNFKYREGIFGPAPENVPILAMVACLPVSHNLGLMLDGEPNVKHLAVWLDSREDILRAADVVRESGLKIEEGPASHTLGQNLYMYVIDPSGFRVELYTEQHAFYQPDKPPNEWEATMEGLVLKGAAAAGPKTGADATVRSVGEASDAASIGTAMKSR
jgi:catechol 2,3-dioxygenase